MSYGLSNLALKSKEAAPPWKSLRAICISPGVLKVNPKHSVLRTQKKVSGWSTLWYVALSSVATTGLQIVPYC